VRRRGSGAADARVPDADVVAELGVLGRPWRAIAHVDGSIEPPGGGAAFAWCVLAEDRVHEPATSPTRRTRLVDGAPVFETAVRVPGGDVVVTAYGVADGGGAVVVDVANRSGASVAFACSPVDVVTARPLSPAPPGAPVPAGWAVSPLAHGATVRLALPVPGATIAAGSLARLPDPDAVVRGWQRQLAGPPTLDLPEPDVAERILRSRAHACLAAEPDPAARPASVLRYAAARAGRVDEAVDVGAVAHAVEVLARRLRGAVGTPWDDAAALVGARGALVSLGEPRAVADLDALLARLPVAEPAPDEAPADDERYEAWLTSRLAVARAGAVAILPTRPAAWLGTNLSAYDVPTAAGPVGFAVRWHGARPALLWEGPSGVTFTCPGLDPTWSSSTQRGEALLAAPG
jgi:hypothetical protein